MEFGGGMDGKSVKEPWKGKVEGIAIYDRAVRADEAAANYAEYAKKLGARKPLQQIKVEATLAAKSEIPAVAKIAPYHSALIVYEYDVTKVLKGTYNEKTLRVAHWALAYKKRMPVAKAKPGDAATLLVERFTDHPELGAEFISDTLPENFDLTIYVDPKMPDPPAQKSAGSIKGKLSLARSYLAAGRKDKAKEILLEIVDKYPDSEHTPAARKMLEGL